MGFFREILDDILSLHKTIVSNALPSDTTILNEKGLNEAIRLSKISLKDDFILKRPKLLASANYALAINYYRKASFFSNLNGEDISQSIVHAHQAESFFNREDYSFHWRQLRKVLGMMYLVKADGVRAEHYEAAISYLTDWLDSSDDSQEQAEAHFALMTAYAGRLQGTKEESLQKMEEHYKKALECSPDDTRWVSFVNQMKGVSTLAHARHVIDKPTGDEFYSLPQIIEAMNGDGSWVNSGRFEPIQLFIALNKFNQIIEKAVEILPRDLTESQMKTMRHLLNNNDFFHLMREFSPLVPEKADLLLTEIDELIQENAQFAEKLGEATEKNEKAESETLISLLYVMRAGLCQNEAKVKESFEKAEFYFETAWEHKTHFLQRPLILFWQGKTFGTILYFFRQKWSKAEKLYKKGLEALETNYKSSMGSPGKSVVLSQLSSHDTPLSLNYAFVLAKQGKAQEAVVSLEKWRGRELNERLNRNNYMLEKVSPANLEAYRKLWDEISRSELEMQDRGDDEYLALAMKLREKRTELENLISEIRTYLPDFLLEPDFSMIQGAARPEKPLVYLLTTTLGSLILIITSDGEVRSLFFEAFKIADAGLVFEELQSALEKIKSGSSDMSGFAEALKKAGQYFIQTLINELHILGATSACLIPCGILSQFPWHAAPTPEGEILLDFFDVSYAPTTKFLFDAQQKLNAEADQPDTNRERFVGIANPNNNLPYAGSEVKNIAGLCKSFEFETDVLTQQKATKESIRNSLPSDVIHFACHGTFNSPDPLDSALILADNERLSLREILEQDAFQPLTQTRLVVLSACQTALVDINEKPEENIGLPLGFLSKGVPGVLGTLWSVNDKSSALLMMKFYDIWLNSKNVDSLSPSAALKEAQNWFRQASKEDLDKFDSNFFQTKQNPFSRETMQRTKSEINSFDSFKNPYFWAGFISIGA
jgi:CHAT domain-containing protein